MGPKDRARTLGEIVWMKPGREKVIFADWERSLTMHVITTGTLDKGDKFVVRKHHFGRESCLIEDACTEHDTLEEARAALPDRLIRSLPAPGDDPVLVEWWL